MKIQAGNRHDFWTHLILQKPNPHTATGERIQNQNQPLLLLIYRPLQFSHLNIDST